MSQLYVVVSAQSSSFTAECDCLAHRFGNAADHPDRRPRYGTDMTDAEWVVVRAALPVPAWMDGRVGRPESYCHRQMIDAVRYLVDNGVKWRNLPVDFPPKSTVWRYFDEWRYNGTLDTIHDLLRKKVRTYEKAHCPRTTASVDSQSVDTTSGGERTSCPTRPTSRRGRRPRHSDRRCKPPARPDPPLDRPALQERIDRLATPPGRSSLRSRRSGPTSSATTASTRACSCRAR